MKHMMKYISYCSPVEQAVGCFWQYHTLTARQGSKWLPEKSNWPMSKMTLFWGYDDSQGKGVWVTLKHMTPKKSHTDSAARVTLTLLRLFFVLFFDSNLESCLLCYESHNDTLQVSSLLSIDSCWSHIDPHEIFLYTVFDSNLESNLLLYNSHNDTLQVSSLLSIDSSWSPIDPHGIFLRMVFDYNLESSLLYDSHNDILKVSSLLSIDYFWR